MVDSLRFMQEDTLDCRADLFWRIVAKGKEAIPFLINKLADTTPTSIRYHCKKSPLNIGEVAHFALVEIASFPAFVVTHIQFDFFVPGDTGKPCWSFYDFLFMNDNKPRYQASMKEWYAKEKNNYKTQRIPKNKQNACQKKFGINTFYRWKG